MCNLLDLPNELLHAIACDLNTELYKLMYVSRRLNSVSSGRMLKLCNIHDPNDITLTFTTPKGSAIPDPLTALQMSLDLTSVDGIRIQFESAAAASGHLPRVLNLFSRLAYVGKVGMVLPADLDEERGLMMVEALDIAVSKNCHSIQVARLSPNGITHSVYEHPPHRHQNTTFGLPPTERARRAISCGAPRSKMTSTPTSTRLSGLSVDTSLLYNPSFRSGMLRAISQSPIIFLRLNFDVEYASSHDFLRTAAPRLLSLRNVAFTGLVDTIPDYVIPDFCLSLPRLACLTVGTSEPGLVDVCTPQEPSSGLTSVTAPYYIIEGILRKTFSLTSLRHVSIVPHRIGGDYPCLSGILRVIRSISDLLRKHDVKPEISLYMISDKIGTVHTPVALTNRIGTWMEADVANPGELQREEGEIATLVKRIVFRKLTVLTRAIPLSSYHGTLLINSNIDLISRWVALFPSTETLDFDIPTVWNPVSWSHEPVDGACKDGMASAMWGRLRATNECLRVVQLGRRSYPLPESQ